VPCAARRESSSRSSSFGRSCAYAGTLNWFRSSEGPSGLRFCGVQGSERYDAVASCRGDTARESSPPLLESAVAPKPTNDCRGLLSTRLGSGAGMRQAGRARGKSSSMRENTYWLLGLSIFGCSSSESSAPHDGGAVADVVASNLVTQPQVDSGALSVGSIIAQVDGGVVTKLPALASLTNVTATLREDSVGIDFDPFDGAIDYRVYPLPNDEDITVNPDGSVSVRNAIYRCAGVRQTYDLPTNRTSNDSDLVTASGQYSWAGEVSTDPTLGYVYVSPGADRVPVYAVAGYTTGGEVGWRESRLKVYTTDASERQTLLSQGWRDDGVVFYAPAAASNATSTVYASQTATVQPGQDWTQYAQYYFTSADLASHSGDTTPPAAAFQVLTAQAAETRPLMAVTYQPSDSHVELAVGQERYNRATAQGATGPLWHLEWSGITQPTTLVVEALASGCPFQGFLSPQHLDAPPHQTFFTLADLTGTTSAGEVFVNGQYDRPGTPIETFFVDGGVSALQTPTASPIPVARSFIQVAPVPHGPGDWDWYQGFTVGSDFGTVTAVPGCTDFNCGRWQSSAFDLSVYRLDEPSGVMVFTYGQLLGQLWVAYDDYAQDTTGKVRFTALQTGNIDADPTTFLHATMSVDIVSTDRRYPQLIISDQDAPVQEALSLPNNNTLLIQPILGPSMRIEAEAIHGLVNGSPWDVNNQAPEHRFIDYDMAQPGSVTIPTEPPFEHAGVDRMTRFDVYVSSQRMYLFLDGTPAGCSLFPSGFVLQGAVTVTFGDVLYHEGAPDELICYQPRPYSFLYAHQCEETKRHFDDLAFKSGAAAPTWDETQLPCAAY